MSHDINQNHPKQKLLFFAAQDLDSGMRSDIRNFVLELASLRRWVNGPPRFVNSREEPEDASQDDMPVETVGGYIEIYSAFPPWELPIEIDMQHFEEVTALVTELSQFSREQSIVFELELDGMFVGAITDGEIDRSLAQGLLYEWERKLGK